MTFWAAQVRNAGLWWVLPLQAVAWAVIWLEPYNPEPGYALSEQARASESVILCMPVLALAGSVLGGKLAKAGFLTRPWGRNAWAVIGGPIAVLSLPTMLFTIVLHGITAARFGMDRGAMALLVVPLAWSVLATLFGWLLGSLMRAGFAAPLAVISTYVAVGFPAGFSPVWLRHMVGWTSGCCFIDERYDFRAALSAAVVLTGALAALWCVLLAVRFDRSTSLIAAVAVLVGCLTAGAGLASSLGVNATLPRQGTPACTAVESVELCAWPEHTHILSAASPDISEVLNVARREGLLVPRSYMELPESHLRWPQAVLHLNPDMTNDQIQWALIYSLTPRPSSACQSRMDASSAPGEAELMAAAPQVAAAWLADRAGVAPNTGLEEIRNWVSPEAQRLLDATAADGASVRRLQQAVLDCNAGQHP